MFSWTFFLEALLRSIALLLGCELLLRLSKRRSAALRHRLLLWVFALLVTLPIFCVFLPPIFQCCNPQLPGELPSQLARSRRRPSRSQAFTRSTGLRSFG